jgi:asparagine synthase (glutamine-hydrolysing)
VPADDAWPLKNFDHRGPDLDSPYVIVYQLLREQACEAAKKDGVATLMTGDRGDEVVGDWVYDLPGLLAAGRWREALAERRAHRSRTGGSFVSFLRSQLVGPAVRAVRGHDRPSLRIPPWIPRGFSERIDLPTIIADGVVRVNIRRPAGAARYGRIFRTGGAHAAAWQERSNARAGLGWADPWADQRLAEFVVAMPQYLVNRMAEPKRLAHHALRPVMPRSTRGRSRKIIPELLFDRGFKHRGAGTVRDLFSESIGQQRGFVDAAAFLSDYERFCADERIATDPWWTITLEGWLRVVQSERRDVSGVR